MASRILPAVCGPTRDHVQKAKAGDSVARVLGEPKHRQHVLDMGAVEELQSAEFHEGNVAPGQLHLQWPAVARSAKQHCLLFQRHADLAVFQHLLDDIARLVGLIGDRQQLRPFR